MLVIYRKDTGKVLHYAPYDGVTLIPSLFGLYGACLKANFPELNYDDYGELIVDNSQAAILVTNQCSVEDGELVAGEAVQLSDPPEPDPTQEDRISQLEQQIADLQAQLSNIQQ